jgi:hypothetical protein
MYGGDWDSVIFTNTYADMRVNFRNTLLAMSHKLEKVIICWLVSGVTIDYCLISFQNTFLNVGKKHKEKCW